MLTALTVRDIVLIETAALDFAPGLNVLTGETGAGKSILLDSLGLATGERGRASVRVGATQGSVTALFDPPARHPARNLLTGQAIPSDGELVLRRTLSADGRSRAFVNDEPVSVQFLKELGGLLLEVHGQSDDRGLFDVATHRGLLDEFGRLSGLLTAVTGGYDAYREAAGARQTLRTEQAKAAADGEFLSAAVAELSALDVTPGEEAALADERALLMNASHIAESVAVAAELLSGDDGAETKLAGALRRIARLAPEAQAATGVAAAALEAACASAEEAGRELSAFLSKLEADPAELERKEERLFAIRAAARKYACAPDDLPAKLAAFAARRELIDLGDDALKSADAAVAQAEAAFRARAVELSAARAEAAGRLETAVAAELKPLKLGHAQFRVAFSPCEPSATGLERVAFEVATVAGAPFGPLAKIASGGELARFSLALKVALAEEGPPAALVFDEVDRGVGGAVADAVGERLQRLARKTQVLLVTHSPQVAARGTRHFRIVRAKDKTRVIELDDGARLEEVARMLSGAEITEEARAAARRLIEEAAPKTRKKA